MHLRQKFALLFLLGFTFTPGNSLLFPLLFPLSIKITIHSNSKPPPPPEPSYHFEPVPVYREVVVKGSAQISSVPKYSYGDGTKYGTSYGDGHAKVYTDEPHIRGHKYATGYGSGGSIDGHFTITSNPATPSTHYKGSAYDDSPPPHYKGIPYPQTPYKGSTGGTHYEGPIDGTHYEGPSDGTYYEEPIHGHHYKGSSGTHYKGSSDGTHYKGSSDGTHYKGSSDGTHYKGSSDGTYYKGPSDGTHYKGSSDGTHYKGSSDGTHYKGSSDGTHYKGSSDGTHYKGTAYEEDVPSTHYKGTVYDEVPNHYKGSSHASKPKLVYNSHNYIKSVGGYKLTDYLDEAKTTKYPNEDDPDYIAVPPGKTYAEIAAAHKAAHAPKAYDAQQYADLGSPKYNKEYEHEQSYIDDTIPVYKSNIPRPRYRYQASASRHDRTVAQPKESKESKVYAGFGTAIYGDSYAKIVYVPKTLRISIRTYPRK